MLFSSMQHRGEIKGRGHSGRAAACVLYQSNLDVNTAAVKELMHGPYTGCLCEMNFYPAVGPFLMRNPKLALEEESLQLSVACCTRRQAFVYELIIHVHSGPFTTHT